MYLRDWLDWTWTVAPRGVGHRVPPRVAYALDRRSLKGVTIERVPVRLALDRGSVRDYDADGRLHVKEAAISKANVCPYWGHEIPDYEKLGLDPDKKYKLLRHPDELKKAAATFNGIPVLEQHEPITADKHEHDLVVGSTGNSARWDPPYLKNSLHIWPRSAIDAIEDGGKKQLSSAYRYHADMTPGTHEGVPYDGVMRDIVGNHVALVREGRAGADVVVGDANFEEGKHPRDEGGKFASNPGGKTVYTHQSVNYKDPGFKKNKQTAHEHAAYLKNLGHEGVKVTRNEGFGATGFSRGMQHSVVRTVHHGHPRASQDNFVGGLDRRGSNQEDKMTAAKLAPKAALAKGALLVYLTPRLGQDAKVDLNGMLRGITGKNFSMRRPQLESAIRRAVRGQLAADADVDDLVELLDKLEDEKVEDQANEPADGLQPEEEPLGTHPDPEDGVRTGVDSPELLAKIKDFLKDHVSPEVLAQLDGLAEHEGEDESEEEKKKWEERAADARRKLGRDETEEERKKREEEQRAEDARRAKDEPPDFEGKPKPGGEVMDKKGMDAAIGSAVSAAIRRERDNARAMREAEQVVRVVCGDLAMDEATTAADVYRIALDALGYDTTDLHPSAFRKMLEMHRDRARPEPRRVASDDAAGQKSFAARHPHAAKISVMS